MSAYTYGASRKAEVRREHEQLVDQVSHARLLLAQLQRQIRSDRHKARVSRRTRINTQPTEDIRIGAEKLIEQLKETRPEDAHLGPARLRAAANEAHPYKERRNVANATRDHQGRFAA